MRRDPAAPRAMRSTTTRWLLTSLCSAPARTAAPLVVPAEEAKAKKPDPPSG